MPQPGRAEVAGNVPGPDQITENRYRMAPVGTQAMQAGRGRLAWKNSTRLADGREIIYFDEAPELNRVQARDLREGLAKVPGPDEVSPEQSLRWDPLLGEWVVIAAARQERTFLPPPDQCPLDPSAPGRPTEVPADSYDVVVFENRFPSLRGASAIASATTGAGLPALDDGLAEQRPGYGRCEVVCFTSDHNASFAQLTPRRVRTVIEAWADRTEALSAMAGIEQVYIFENRGVEIGVTLHHPHGQIYAFPFVTPRVRQQVTQARSYGLQSGQNLFEDLVAAELAEGTRIVARNEDWVAFVPPAARWPYEVLLFPVRRVPDLAALDDAARDALGHLYLDVLRRFDGLFGTPAPYISAWHQAPVTDVEARREFGLHLQVFTLRRAPGKLKYLAGTESGMGVWINDIAPETAAQRLREAG